MHFLKHSYKGGAHFEDLHKSVMHIFETLIQRLCIFYDLYKIVVHIFEARTVGINVHEGKIN